MSTTKTLFLLNIGDYERPITEVTYPLIYGWADKIGAKVHVIRERKFPDWPITYEKLQIHQLAREIGSEWNIYVDSDALIHPQTPDWTMLLPRDTVAHNGIDFAGIRWRPDEYFLRDGRNISSCNWFTIASDWCLDLWRPLEITPAEAISRIYPTLGERASGMVEDHHLVDDYALSSNIARFGLKVLTIDSLRKRYNLGDEAGSFFHAYALPGDDFTDGTRNPDGSLAIKPGKMTLILRALREGWGLDVQKKEAPCPIPVDPTPQTAASTASPSPSRSAGSGIVPASGGRSSRSVRGSGAARTRSRARRAGKSPS